jgi:hypothetical protein
MIAISGIVAAVIVCRGAGLVAVRVESASDPPEQRHDVLTGDQGGDECMEGSFEEW